MHRSPGPLDTSPLIHPAILQSLKTVFELAGPDPRSTHHFFAKWRSFDRKCTSIKSLLATNHTTLSALEFAWTTVEADLDDARELLIGVKEQVAAVKRNVGEATRIHEAQRRASGLKVSANLGEAFRMEGIAYRRCVSTFPEVQKGEMELSTVEEALRKGWSVGSSSR